MLLGNPDDFAIEVMVEPDLKAPSPVWGRMRVWIGETSLGDFNNPYCALLPPYHRFKSYVEHCDSLWADEFDGLTLEEIYDTVFDAIYGNHQHTLAQIKDDSQRFSRFDFLTTWGESFDGISSVILSPEPDKIAILHRPRSHHPLKSNFVVASCSLSGLVEAATQFVTWFEAEEIRLSSKSK